MKLHTVLVSALLAACSPQQGTEATPTAEATPERHTISGLAVVPLTIDTGERKHSFKVEVANTPEAQTRGLMFRTEMAPDEGMIFPTELPATRSFWMRNTPLPLDLIFIGEDRTIRNIAAMAEPYSLKSIPSDGPVIAVLELVGGRAKELGIEPGDKVTW